MVLGRDVKDKFQLEVNLVDYGFELG